MDEIEKFFVNYAAQQGKDFRFLGTKNADDAMDLVKKALKNGKQR
jgi:inorganic pyrophosphatase